MGVGWGGGGEIKTLLSGAMFIIEVFFIYLFIIIFIFIIIIFFFCILKER